MTLFFASHEITIRRMRPAGASKTNFSATFTGYPADIQPASKDRIELAGGRVGQVFEAWVDPEVPVKEGDQIDANGYRYSVKAITKFQGAGLLDHKQLLLMKDSGDN